MGSTVLVFVPLMALWAAILVPMWLRNHDAAVESKSVDRFSTAMNTLSRRGPRAQAANRGARDVLVPARTRTVELSGGRAPSVVARRERAAKLARMRRRRTAAIALLGFFVVVALATVVGAAPVWLPFVVLLVTGGFAWNLRAKAVREARLERRKRRTARPAPAARRPATRELAPRAPSWPISAERQGAVPVGADVAFARTSVAAEVDNGWAPTPIVLPTYATAPPATSVPRVIDLTHPGSWSAAHMLDAMAAGNAPDPDEIFDGRADTVASSVADAADAELFDQYEAEHEAVAETVAGSTAQSFLDDDAVFDQTDDDQFLEFLDRRASGS